MVSGERSVSTAANLSTQEGGPEMKKVIVILMALAMVLAVSGAASAATTTTNLNVSATVGAVCTVSTIAVNFGSLDPLYGTLANGDVTVTCATGVPYWIALDAGTNSIFAGVRAVSIEGVGPDFVPYWLFKDTAFGEEWGDSDFGNTYQSGFSLGDTGNGTAQSHTVYGLINIPNQGEPPGTYTDTVVVTVHY
jgi:spore coat protein U-like protein